MRISLIFLLLISAFTVLGQNSNVALDGQPREQPAKSTIRARVFYEDTGRPVKRTSVMLMSKDGGGRENGGVTDDKGNLEIKNLRAGKYYAIVNAPGTVSPLAYMDVRKSRTDSFEEQLGGFDGIVVNGLTDIDTQIPVRRGGAISGRVTYSDGDVAIGVKVEVLRKVDDDYLTSISNFSILSSIMSGGAGSLVTDDRGYFRMAGLPAGEYIVKVSENVNHSSNSTRGYSDPFESLLFGNGSMLTVFFENAFEKQNAKAISVAFGEEKPEISMMIPDWELHVIEGRIVAAKDKFPIRNSTIYLQRVGEETNSESPASNRLRQNCVTDENGNWKFAELPKGKYKLIAEADGSEFDDVKKAYGYANSNQAVNRSVYNEMSNRSGRPPARKFAKSIQEVTIEDKDISNKLIELNFGSVVAGTASTEDGKPMPTSVTVMVSNEEADISSSTQMSNYAYEEEQPVIKSSNDFQIQGVTPGKTYLTVVVNENSYYVKSVTAGNVDLLKEPFTIKDGEDLKNVKIVLSSDLGTLKGTIMNTDKEPIPRLKIGLFPTDPLKYKNSTFYRSTVSNESGEFVTKLPPMEYAVIFLPAGFANMSRNDGQKWLANAMKDAQKFTIESGKTEKITIKHDTKKTEK